jgi:hypothetical protein
LIALSSSSSVMNAGLMGMPPLLSALDTRGGMACVAGSIWRVKVLAVRMVCLVEIIRHSPVRARDQWWRLPTTFAHPYTGTSAILMDKLDTGSADGSYDPFALPRAPVETPARVSRAFDLRRVSRLHHLRAHAASTSPSAFSTSEAPRRAIARPMSEYRPTQNALAGHPRRRWG